jgi:hypothetical protein
MNGIVATQQSARVSEEPSSETVVSNATAKANERAIFLTNLR